MFEVDYTRDNYFGEQALKLLKDYYMLPDEQSPQDAFRRACLAYSMGDIELAKRLYDYVSRGWFMFASPVLSNAPRPGERWKSLPISCFLNYVPDSIEGLIEHTSETRWLSVKGGGVGGHWSDIRSVSNVAPGPIPFIKTVDSDMFAYRQGKTRKGSYAAYIDVSHPDIEEFLSIRIPTGGDPSRKCFEIHNAVNVTDKFMEAVTRDLPWDLVDPHTGKVTHTFQSARLVWEKIIETRFRTGEPYINFIDEANRHLPQSQKDKGLKIRGSNLCFAACTKVILADGRRITMREMSKMDQPSRVVGAKFVDGIWLPYTDKAICKLTARNATVINLLFEDGGCVTCTPDHKFATMEGNYIEAKNARGKYIQAYDDLKYKLKVTGIEYIDQPIDVYDLRVDNLHNFFVETDEGRNGVLVHNCNEIHLATDSSRTAVCCLSSLNLELFDDWKDTRIVQDLITMLDNVLQIFIDNCPDSLSKARFSASMERSLGLGAMGFHSYLQRRGIPFESGLASSVNRKIFRIIQERAKEQSRKLALERGEPEDMLGTGLRNAHLIAVAPNANSAIIVGCSPSIEPYKSNAFSYRTRAGTHLNKNKYLEQLLETMGRNTPEVWQTVILDHGSVKRLDFLTEDQKAIFRTAFELDQRWIVDHAGGRQPFICQGQSVNLFFPSGTPRSYVNEVHMMAWRKGLKGLYYLRSSAEKAAEKISHKTIKSQSEGCLACHA